MYIDNKQLKNNICFWLVSMFLIISFMIIIGGLTRLTDSGLSITEWELFSGFLPPLSNSDWNHYFNLYKKIPEYKIQNESIKKKIDPMITKRIWKNMIWSYINYERKNFKKK